MAKSGTGKALVIVESPAKARTIAGFLGDDFMVESSIGHIRDLPKSAAEIPLSVKKEPWSRLGVNVDDNFQPLYVVHADKKQHIQKLKTMLKDADELYLATDEDREGESIAWHLFEVLSPKIPVKRMVFHEITKKAIDHAIAHPRSIDRHLVDAQETRRILDRLFGYKVSEVLWKKVLPGLSAGRVQSVATRIIVDRERARMRFVSAQYWDIDGLFEKTPAKAGEEPKFQAKLQSLGGKRLATGKDFGENGKLTVDALSKGVRELDAAGAAALKAGLSGVPFRVASVEQKPYRRSPSAPFMTSTLQQEAGRKLRFSTVRTMRAAQRLYESGYITYMRTDSTTLSEAAITAARRVIEDLYGREYLPSGARTYPNKVKNAQEAHEAIRPAGEAWKKPEDVEREVGVDEARVYELVWKRTVASQMQDAVGQSVSIKLEGTAKTSSDVAEFACSGTTITFPGFLRAYVEGSDDPEAELESKDKVMPELKEGAAVSGLSFEVAPHETQPPARYTEASLVKRLEELGVGRPSTYAATIGTVQDRGYVFRKGTALVPSFTAFAVVGLLEKHFPELVEYAFTARMEDELDQIANGTADHVPWLKRFYFGSVAADKTQGGTPVGVTLEHGLLAMVTEQMGDIDARSINSIPIGSDPNGVAIIARVGKFGPYLQRGDDTVSIPEDMAPDELTPAKATELLAAPSGDRELGKDPETGLPIFVKSGRFGAYVQMGDPKETGEKPKTSSLFKTMTPASTTLEDALMLLTLPRTLGEIDGEVVQAFNGKFGPYILKGKDSRNLESEEQLLALTLDDAKAKFAQPKERRRKGQAAPSKPAKELGLDPVSQKTIVLKDGRFGPYVTDGETIASLRRGDNEDNITPERAQELLGEKRSRGPVEKKGAKKTAKKAAKKSDTAEKLRSPKW